MTNASNPTAAHVHKTARLMRMFRVCWALLMLGFLLVGLPSKAFAAASTCFSSSSGSLTMGNVAVPVGAANGTLLGTPVQLTMVFNCTGVPSNSSGLNLFVQAGNLAARDASDTGSGGIIFATGVTGIGLKLTAEKSQAGSRAWIRGGPNSTAGFEIGALDRTCNGSGVCTATYTETFTAQFVKTATVTPGTVQGRQLMQFWWYEYGTTASSGPMGTALTLNGGAQVIMRTCSVAAGSQNFTVTLPTVSTAALPSQGSTAGRTRFTIDLNCPAGGATTSITFATGNAVSGMTGVLASTAGSTSRGVGVQLLDSDSSPIAFNTAEPLGISPTGVWSVPFHAQYYRTTSSNNNNNFRAGTVTTTATFTMTYQ